MKALKVQMNKPVKKSFSLICILLLFLLTSCVTLQRPVISAQEEDLLYPVTSYVPETFDWQEVIDAETNSPAAGLWRFDFESHDPDFPLIYHLVKIELAPEVNDDQKEDKAAHFKLSASQWEHTFSFAKREHCLVAMNATPFGRKSLAGIFKMKGHVLSEPVERYGALGLRCDKDNTVTAARVFESQTDEELADWDAAFGGFFIVLKDGQVCTEFVRRSDSRSGAGVSADGKILYLLVVEGERMSQSRGLSYPQCGQIFRALGCSDALEFDGGGSSDLCINGSSVLSYKVGRIQGNSFGFRN